MNHPESILQRQCVRWFRLQYPKLSRLLYANANGGKRSRIEAAIMQGEGVTAGIPDLTLAVPSAPFHGLYVEMKAEGGKTTPKQREMQHLLFEQGYAVHTCYSLDEFMSVVNSYLNAKPC